MIIDLHTHTCLSDGLLSCEKLLSRARTNNVKYLSITDHDLVTLYQDPENKIQFVSGIELSTVWSGVGVHIVGLGFDPKSPEILRGVAFQKEARMLRIQKIIKRLAQQNIDIDDDELFAFVGHDQIGRLHLAHYLIHKKIVSNTNQAFSKYLGAGKVGDVKNLWAGFSEVVEWISKAGGIAVIAHPDRYKMTRMKQSYFIDAFIEAGGQAIEVISNRQSKESTDKYIRIANKKQMLISVGSDFHGYNQYNQDIGISVDHLMLQKIPAVWNHLFDIKSAH